MVSLARHVVYELSVLESDLLSECDQCEHTIDEID